MEEFLRQNYSLLTKLVITLAAVTGLISYKKYRHTAAKYFIWFLICVGIIELIGGYKYYLREFDALHLIEGTIIQNTYWWYTLTWTIGGVLLITYYYRQLLNSQRNKKMLKFGSIAFILVILGTLVTDWKQIFGSFPMYIEMMSFILILMCVTLYFIEIITTEKILTFYKSLSFYVTCAILFWWLINTPLLFYEGYSSTSDWNYVILKWQIRLFANIVTYLTFTFALIWCNPQND